MPKVKMPGQSYLSVADPARQMEGEGAPRSTVFGVLGRTKESPYTKTLGGLVEKAPDHRVMKGTVEKSHGIVTERDIVGNISKTKIPGKHYAQVPYAGMYMSHLGERL